MEQVECLRLLHSVTCALKSGGRAVDKADMLEDFISRRHKNLPALQIVPKAEGPLHTPFSRGHEAGQETVDCWCVERHHRPAKQTGSYTYKSISTCLLRKCFVRMARTAGRPEVYQVELTYPLRNNRSPYGELLHAHGLQLSARGGLARTGFGFFKKDDFVLWHGNDLAQPWGAGLLKEVVVARRAGGDEPHVCGRGHVCARGRSALSRRLGL